jgi:xylose isomerase
MADYFKDVPKIKYEGKHSTNPLSFKYYNPDEIIGGKTMEEQLKFAMSYWHTLCAEGTDMFGVGTADKSFGTSKDPMELAKAKVKAGFELMTKLNIKYFCFHDADIAPPGETLSETYNNIDIITLII